MERREKLDKGGKNLIRDGEGGSFNVEGGRKLNKGGDRGDQCGGKVRTVRSVVIYCLLSM